MTKDETNLLPTEAPSSVEPEPSASNRFIAPPQIPGSARPWGFFATIGWAILIACAYLIVQSRVVEVWFDLTRAQGRLGWDGALFAVSIIIGALAMISFCAAIASFRKAVTAKSYFALNWPEPRVIVRWTLITIALAIGSDALAVLLGRPVVPEFMIDSYEVAGRFRPLLCVAVVVAAPIGEETFFRGFIFAGIRQSRAGATGVILLTAIIWAAMHLQYDLYGMINVFTLGIMLGIAREKTNSMLVCIYLHALVNSVATAELLVYRAITKA